MAFGGGCNTTPALCVCSQSDAPRYVSIATQVSALLGQRQRLLGQSLDSPSSLICQDCWKHHGQVLQLVCEKQVPSPIEITAPKRCIAGRDNKNGMSVWTCENS
eukprot:5976383-Amphidinium_carterae.1